MKIYSISNYSPKNNHILQKNKNALYCVSFRGVSLEDFNTDDNFDYANSKAGGDEDIAKKI